MIRKLFLAAATALVALFAAAGVASAASATVEPAGAITSASLGKISFTGGEITIRCNLTLNGTLSRGPIELVAGRTLGSIREVSVRECEGGTVSAILNLPYTITLSSIPGTIPSAITGILFTLPRAAFNLSIFGGFVNCLYEGTLGAVLGVTAIAGTREPWRYTTGLISTLASRFLLIRGGFGCPTGGTLSGAFSLRPTQTISVR